MNKPARTAAIALLFAAVAGAPAVLLAQVQTPPKPIPVPPIPAPPQLGAQPKITLPPIVPPPKSGTQTPAPPMASPGAVEANIQETFFIVDPGSAQFPATAQNKLLDIAKDMVRNPASRLEVRTFSPAKPHSEGTARRLSLSRFQAIREFLTHNGVGDDRIDGRPLASEPNELNADRVELYIEQ